MSPGLTERRPVRPLLEHLGTPAGEAGRTPVASRPGPRAVLRSESRPGLTLLVAWLSAASVAVADILTGSHTIFVGLLGVAPVLASRQSSRRATALIAAVVTIVAFGLGLADKNLLTAQHGIDTVLVAAIGLLSISVSGFRGDLERSLERAEVRSRHDSLTSLLARHEVIDRAEGLMQLRTGTRPAIALLMLDVDRFKDVNDEHGHLAGDRVLAEVARRVDGALRADDMVGRYGGDEFLAVLVGGAPEEAFGVTERVRAAVAERPVATPFGTIQVSVSAGVASARDGEAFDSVLARADAALYKAKTAGRDRSMVS